jgi:hypothetical protein
MAKLHPEQRRRRWLNTIDAMAFLVGVVVFAGFISLVIAN